MANLEWKISAGLVDYQDAVLDMENHVNLMVEGKRSEMVWLLEHEDVYSAGVSAKDQDVIDGKFPVVKTGRGGQVTYHGPGMRIGYIMLDLRKRNLCDLKKYIFNLEQLIINVLAEFGISGERRDGRVGIWVMREDGGEDKIAAIGVRVRKWVTFHGIAINVDPQLDNFLGIVPCGIKDKNYGVTSFKELDVRVTMEQFDEVFRKKFLEIFG